MLSFQSHKEKGRGVQSLRKSMTCALFPCERSMVFGAFSCTFAEMLSTLFSRLASFFSSASMAAGVSKVLVKYS